jgi:hypothetical protein
VPLIAVAETCSWYSELTTANIGHVAEKSIWDLLIHAVSGQSGIGSNDDARLPSGSPAMTS